MILNRLKYVTVIFFFLLASIVNAEQKEVFDGPDGSEYEVHYIAFVSTFLSPETAKQYQLIRSKALGMVNVSIIKVDSSGKRTAVGASVETRMSNNIQQQQFLSFQQVVEGSAIYYLSQFQFAESELLTFDLTVYPEGGVKPLSVRFSQNFYND